MTGLAEVLARPAWALIRLEGEADIVAIGGVREEHDLLRDVPLETGPPVPGARFDRLLCVPYRQIRERGFAAYDDKTALSSIVVDIETSVSLSDVEAVADPATPTTTGAVGFDTSDADYACLVSDIIRDDIGNGEGANLVVARDFHANLDGWGVPAALGAFARLLRQERGAYWTFVVNTGDRFLIGASPERHVRVSGGEVSMNPISGTFRIGADNDPERLTARLLDFLADEKEIFELFMVVDEELKMMCAICSEGGAVSGPFLKQMSHVVHTEYLLNGRTGWDVRDVLRDSMFAATVTGSPVENACRLIERHEGRGRGYYGAVLALLGRDRAGAPTLDAPIVLRTADVTPAGRLRVTAGATLVRDSDPASEVAETVAKAAGVLSAFGLTPPAVTPAVAVSSLVETEQVRDTLAVRNARLSRFWLDDQSEPAPDPVLNGKRVVVLDGEDDFVAMLRHLLGVLGMRSDVVSHRDYVDGDLDGADLVIVGPGPGDPRDLTDTKIATIRSVVDELLETKRPFLAVCLGHQVLCGALGLPLGYKDIVFQGTQTEVSILGRSERVGFYNTFVARAGDGVQLPVGVSVDADSASGDVHLIRGPHFAGIQFHAESILTENGPQILRELVAGVVAPTT